MGYTSADIATAQGRYLTCSRDPRTGPGLNYIAGTVVVFGTMLLQKQSSVATDWTVVGGGGTPTPPWGAPTTVQTTAVDGAIAATTSLERVDASTGARIVSLPAAASATQAVIVKKIDGTGNTVTVTGTGAELPYVINTPQEARGFISNGATWSIVI